MSGRPEAREDKMPLPPDRPQRQQPTLGRNVASPSTISAEVRKLVDSFAAMKAAVPHHTVRKQPRSPRPSLSIPEDGDEDQPLDEELYVEPQFLRDGLNITHLRQEFRQFLPDVGIHYNMYLQNRPGVGGNEQHLVIETQVDQSAQETLDNFLKRGTYYRQNVEGGDDDNAVFAFQPHTIDVKPTEMPEQLDWDEILTECYIRDTYQAPQRVEANPFQSGKRIRFSVKDVHRLMKVDNPAAAVIYHPPSTAISSYRRNARQQGLPILESNELPTKLRKPLFLQQLAGYWITYALQANLEGYTCYG